jgi:hypothetical protein
MVEGDHLIVFPVNDEERGVKSLDFLEVGETIAGEDGSRFGKHIEKAR